MNQNSKSTSQRWAIRALVVAALVLGAAHTRAAEPVKIKFEILPSGHMSVPVKVNGRGPYKIGFDTGSPVTLLSTKLGKELELTRGGGGMPVMGMNFGGQASVQLAVGEASANNVPVMVMDHPTVQTLNQVLGGFEGLIGFSYYSRFRMTIDYQKKEMTLRPSGFEPADITQSVMGLLAMGGGQSAPARVPQRAVVIGLKVEDLGDETAETRITGVVPGSAAETAGMRVGDKVVGLNERWIIGPRDLYEGVAALAPGLPAKLKVVRGDKTLELTLNSRFGL